MTVTDADSKAPVTTSLRSGGGVQWSGQRTVQSRFANIPEWHPIESKIRFVRMDGSPEGSPTVSGDSMDAHYNPKEVSESISAQYDTLASAGVHQERLTFILGHPRKWTMTILLNDWGRDASISPDTYSPKNCDESLRWLRGVTLPGIPSNALSNYSGSARRSLVSTVASNITPPVVLVVMGSTSYAVHITNLLIKHKKINPVSGKTIRAEVSITMQQWMPTGGAGNLDRV